MGCSFHGAGNEPAPQTHQPANTSSRSSSDACTTIISTDIISLRVCLRATRWHCSTSYSAARHSLV
eukprot:6053817-Pleurochrysis_carterae.AAC.1